MAKKRPLKSLTSVAQLLDCEGFNEYVANRVVNWAKQHLGWRKAYERKQAAFREAISGTDEAQRMAIGKFISIQHEIGFQAGLRLGLMCHLMPKATEFDAYGQEQEEGEPPSSSPAKHGDTRQAQDQPQAQDGSYWVYSPKASEGAKG